MTGSPEPRHAKRRLHLVGFAAGAALVLVIGGIVRRLLGTGPMGSFATPTSSLSAW